jgi:hypothetical protein
MIGYDLLVVSPEVHDRAMAEVRAGAADPMAKAIVDALTTLATLMHEHEVGCALCDGDDDSYLFAIAGPPAAVLIGVPAATGLGGSSATPIGGPICEACVQLPEPELRARIMAAMQRAFGGYERRLH